jgi:hypothetical protein
MQQNIFPVFHIRLHLHFTCGILCNAHLSKIHIFGCLELISFYLSTNFNALLPQIVWYRTRLGTLVCNFGEPSRLAFHNLIRGPSIGLQTRSVGETLYCITSQPNKSTKNLNRCISTCPTNVSRPSFKQPKTQDLKSKIS